MERVATGTRMREIDSTAINVRGVPGIDLMERAGEKLTQHLLKSLNEVDFEGWKRTCVIVCGAGNNGGDGYVAARLLENAAKRVSLYTVTDPAKLKGDAKINYERYVQMGGEVKLLSDDEVFESFEKECSKSLIVVDAIFGTGISRPIEGLAAKVIDVINESGVFVVAVDIPSGVDADRGIIHGTAVLADLTVTFQMNKLGMCLEPGMDMAGEIVVEDIGLPEDLCQEKTGAVYIPEKIDIKKALPIRYPRMNKGDAGKVLLVAGSRGMAGAAVLAATAAYRSGAGLVKVAAVWDAIQVVQCAIPEATSLILSNDMQKNLSLVAEEAEKFDCVVIGPGLGWREDTAKLVEYLITRVSKPMLLDADAINIVSENPKILKSAAAPIIMTPHPGEMGRLINKSADYVNNNRLSVAQNFALQYNVTLVLKGFGTIIACPDGKAYLNTTGNSAMATAGSGDVLSGIIGAFVAAGDCPEDAACAGAYVHGLSGDMCEEKIGEYGTIASDIAAIVAVALQDLKKI